MNSTETEKNYYVAVEQNYSENLGDPINYEESELMSLEEAEVQYAKELNEIESENGVYRIVTLKLQIIDEDGDISHPEEIKSEGCSCKEIEEGQIIVTYHSHKYMDYAYVITDVREVQGMALTTEDLNYSKDSLFAPHDKVFEDIEDLRNSYEKGAFTVPFNKINSGRHIIENFLGVYETEEETEEEEN